MHEICTQCSKCGANPSLPIPQPPKLSSFLEPASVVAISYPLDHWLARLGFVSTAGCNTSPEFPAEAVGKTKQNPSIISQALQPNSPCTGSPLLVQKQHSFSEIPDSSRQSQDDRLLCCNQTKYNWKGNNGELVDFQWVPNADVFPLLPNQGLAGRQANSINQHLGQRQVEINATSLDATGVCYRPHPEPTKAAVPNCGFGPTSRS